jgi:hypothetical protein
MIKKLSIHAFLLIRHGVKKPSAKDIKGPNNIIISLLSNEAREILRNHDIRMSTISQRPQFDYIRFCKHLNLQCLESIIEICITNIERSKISFITDEILRLFINKDTKFTHFYLSIKDLVIIRYTVFQELNIVFQNLNFFVVILTAIKTF